MNRNTRYKKPGDRVRGTPEYMLTYGDMTTLLLTFFVFLMAIASFSITQAQNFRVVVTLIQGSLGILAGGNTISDESILNAGLDISKVRFVHPGRGSFKETIGNARRVLLDLPKGRAEVFRDERGVVIQVTDTALFDPDSAVIKDPTVLDRIAPILRDEIEGSGRSIRIEGHTDNVPPRNFPTNWELSTARATNVLKYLARTHNLPPQNFSAVGYGEYKPIAINDTPEGRARNRRVEIVIMRGLSEVTQPERSP
ncbi:MAG: OmpA family protein [bacterium]